MRDLTRLGEEPARDVSRVPRAAESKDKVGKIPHRAPEPDSADASLQRDPRPTAAAHHPRYHVQRHGRRRTSRQENVWQLNGIDTAQFDLQVLLKLGKTRSSKSGQRSTSVMHQTVAFPGLSSYSKNTAKATCSVLASTRETNVGIASTRRGSRRNCTTHHINRGFMQSLSYADTTRTSQQRRLRG